VRDREIDIVTPQQNVVADRDPFDEGIATVFLPTELEQAEIRSAAADVNHQDMAPRGVCVWQRGPWIVAARLLLEPPIERRLRLFQQTHGIGEAGLLRGCERQPLRRRVEGGGNGDRDVLRVECELGALPRKPRVPCCAKMGENERRREDGRNLVLLGQRI
jgi:hypothetical protein